MARDYYGILGLNPDASDSEIKRAYRKKARQYHPDVNDTEEAAERFREISVAQEVLLDPEKRRLVDSGIDPMEQAAGGAGGFGGFGGGGLGDIFDAFFGGGGGARGPRVSRVRPGNDALVGIELSLEDMFSGVERTVTVDTAVVCSDCEGTGSASKAAPVTCSSCQGQGEVLEIQASPFGRVQVARPCHRCEGTGEVVPDPCEACGGDARVRSRRDIRISVPAGISEGMRIRMSGQGEVGPGGGPAGDIYAEVRAMEHPYFIREDDDLHVKLSVPAHTAVLGGDVAVDLLDGSTTLVTIEPGTQPETTLRVDKKGMPHLRREGHGDLYAHVEVTIPTELSKAQRQAWTKLRDQSKDHARVCQKDEGNGGFFSRLRSHFGR